MPPEKASKGILSKIINFFASVKLALVLLITLAVTSILGTVLPQGQPLEMVTQGTSPLAGKLIQFFQLYDMYHSRWFLGLLFLLTLNLIVCSVKRFSTTWKVIKAPPRGVSDTLFTSLPFNQKFSLKEHPIDSLAWTRSLLGRHFGSPVSLPSSQGTAFYLERGRFSRLGVYLVHLSLLIIFLGTVIGSLYGFKGFLELREGESRDQISIKGPQSVKRLDFSVKLDKFNMAFYPNGMPKEYRSDLSVWEQGQEKEKTVIRVNDPFTYKGITFYQSSWDQFPSSIRLSLKKGDQESELWLKMDQKVPLSDSPFSLMAVRYVNDLSNMGPALGVVLLKDGEEVDHTWVLANHPEFHGNQLGEYRLRINEVKLQYLSGLQVNRDPGVWFIWVGSSLMLIGFIIAFYISHRQIWIWVREKKDSKGRLRTEIQVGGTAHKNRGAFVHKMEQLTEKLRSG
ncbi:MAG: cytochrome c biogenesis protein ResB [Thermodesulfobacteriota bacterium]